MAADASDLCTIAEVRAYLQKAVTETGTDAILQTLITSCSDAITQYAGAEFIAVTSAIRKFAYDGGGTLLLAPYSLRTVSAVLIDTDGTSPTSASLTADDYRLHPRTPKHGIYTHIELRNVSPRPGTSSNDFRPTREISISGAWGYATVPSSVKQACVMSVAHQLRRFSNYMGDSGMDGGTADRFGPVALPTAALFLLAPFRVRAV